MKILSLFFISLIFLNCAGKPTVAKLEGESGYHLRPYTVTTWANGLTVITIESHTLPSVSFGLLLKSGSAADSMAKSGLTNLVTSAMVRGTSTRSADQIADQLGDLGSEIESDTAEDYSWFQVSGLSGFQTKLFDIFSDVILHPKFDLMEVDREKKLILGAIQERTDHPEQFAQMAFDSYLFGGHPYSRPTYGSAMDVSALTQKDLSLFYNSKVRPNNSILVITGDLNSTMMNQIKVVFEAWPKGETEPQVFPVVPGIVGVNIRLIDKPDLTQSQVIIGHMGVKRSDPDYLALRVGSLILGGDFSSRLMSQVRVKLGLTYEINSSFEPLLDRGPFMISTFTKNQTVGAAIDETLKVYKKFYDEGVTSQEADDAKNSLLGNFPRVIETPEHLGFNLALLRYYGVSDDYLQNFMQNVGKISASDINAAIKRHMTPENVKILVLSPATEATSQLKTLGLLEVKDFNDVL